MKVKVTNVMVRFLNAHLSGKNYTFYLEKLTPEQYERYVDYDLFKHENDFNIKTSKLNVIRVVYPEEFYACDRYLTTNDLIKCFHNCKQKTASEFINKVFYSIEI